MSDQDSATAAHEVRHTTPQPASEAPAETAEHAPPSVRFSNRGAIPPMVGERPQTPTASASERAFGETRRAPGPAFGTPEFEALLDRKTSSRARTDSKATLMPDNEAAFDERAKLIAGAQKSITVQTWSFESDGTGQALANHLMAAARRGVKVQVIYDSYGNYETGTDPKWFDPMRQAGVEVSAYRSGAGYLAGPNERSHVKSFVVDGASAIVGGRNVGDPYGTKEGWRDMEVKVQGRAARDASANFDADHADMHDQPRAPEQLGPASQPPGSSGESVRMIEHRPHERRDANITNAYVAAANSTEHAIDIETAYFIPPEPVKRALIAAAKRGVKVRVMTNSQATNDNPLGQKIQRRGYGDLLAAGVEIHERYTTTLHSKTAAFDGQYSIVGTANLNRRSDGLDSEMVAAIHSPGVSGQLSARFDEGLSEATPVTKADLDKDPLKDRLQGWAGTAVRWTY